MARRGRDGRRLAGLGRPALEGGTFGAQMGSMKDMPAALSVPEEAVLPPQPRDYSGINWRGLQTLYVREVRRFIKVGTQTLAAPVVTALL